MVQLKRSQLLDHNLTGASFDSNLGFYDETANYTSGKIVNWQNKKWESLNSITGTSEGDLTQSPDIATSDWKELSLNNDSVLYSVYPSSSQSFGSSRITINFNTERLSDSAFSISSGEITFLESGTYVIALTVSIKTTSYTRSGSNTYVQLDTGGGFSDISNLVISTYNRRSSVSEDTASIIFPITVSVNNKIRIQTRRYDGSTLVTLPNGCNITCWKK